MFVWLEYLKFHWIISKDNDNRYNEDKNNSSIVSSSFSNKINHVKRVSKNILRYYSGCDVKSEIPKILVPGSFLNLVLSMLRIWLVHFKVG